MNQRIETYKILIKGKVQGVGFRYWFKRISIKFNITGYVKNLSEINLVEALIQGNKENLKKIIQESKNGPKESIIENIDIQKIYTNKTYQDLIIL